MIHYVLFKFKPGTAIDEILHCYQRTYLKMEKLLPEVENISFKENCVNRDSNMDVMITIELKSKKGLNDYLNHPLHLQFISATGRFYSKSYIFRYRNKKLKRRYNK